MSKQDVMVGFAVAGDTLGPHFVRLGDVIKQVEDELVKLAGKTSTYTESAKRAEGGADGLSHGLDAVSKSAKQAMGSIDDLAKTQTAAMEAMAAASSGNLTKIMQLSKEEMEVRKNAITQLSAIEADLMRTKERDILQMTRAEEQYAAVRKQGLMVVEAMEMDIARSRKQSLMVAEAMAADEARTRKHGLMVVEALEQDQTRTRKQGLLEIEARERMESDFRKRAVQDVISREQEYIRVRKQGLMEIQARQEMEAAFMARFAAGGGGAGGAGGGGVAAGNALNHFSRTASIAATSVTNFSGLTSLLSRELSILSFGVWKVSMNFTLWTGLFAGVSAGMNSLIEKGSKFAEVKQAFDALTSGAGVMGETVLKETQKATRGLISQQRIMESFNIAKSLNVAGVEKNFAEIMGSAVKMSKVLGVDLDYAIKSLVTGLGRGSMRVMDNVGVIMNATEAYRIYADKIGKTSETLTTQEKRTAFAILGEQRLIDNAAKSGEMIETMGQAFTRAKVKMTDAIGETMAYIVTGKQGADAAGGFASAVESLAKKIVDSRDAIRGAITSILDYGQTLVRAAGWIAEFVLENGKLLKNLAEMFLLSKLIKLISTLVVALKSWGVAAGLVAVPMEILNLQTGAVTTQMVKQVPAASALASGYAALAVAAYGVGRAIESWLDTLADLTDNAKKAERGMLSYDWWDKYSMILSIAGNQARLVGAALMWTASVISRDIAGQVYWEGRLKDLEGYISREKALYASWDTDKKNRDKNLRTVSNYSIYDGPIGPKQPGKQAGLDEPASAGGKGKSIWDWLGMSDPKDLMKEFSSMNAALDTEFGKTANGRLLIMENYAEKMRQEFRKSFPNETEALPATEMIARLNEAYRPLHVTLGELPADYRDVKYEAAQATEKMKLEKSLETQYQHFQTLLEGVAKAERQLGGAAAATNEKLNEMFESIGRKEDASPAGKAMADYDKYVKKIADTYDAEIAKAADLYNAKLKLGGTNDDALEAEYQYWQTIEKMAYSANAQVARLNETQVGLNATFAESSPILFDFVQGMTDGMQTIGEQVFELGQNIRQNLTQGFGNAVASVVMGSQTMGQAFKNLGKTILASVVGALAQMAANWLLTLIFGKMVQKTAAQTALTNAAEAYPKMISSASAIPYVGWAIGLAAAETMYARVQGMVGGAAGAGGAGGGDMGMSGAGSGIGDGMSGPTGGYASGLWEVSGSVGQPRSAILHGKEMVVDAPRAEKMRNLVDKMVDGGMGGGNITVPVSFSTPEMLVLDDPSSQDRVARKMVPAVVDEIQRRIKRGEFILDAYGAR